MSGNARGVSTLERVEALLRNPEVYALGDALPRPPASRGGRPRDYPDYMVIVFEALISVYGSARQVEAELSHPRVWSFIRQLVETFQPARSELHLPQRPMRRHHYLYARSRYLADPVVFGRLREIHRAMASSQAVQIGLLDPAGGGSFTHPDRSRLLYGDGKVITPLYKAKPGDRSVDRRTGELRELRHEADAALHFEGTGETAWGTKFVMLAARGDAQHARMLLDFAVVPKPGAEAATALDALGAVAPLVPGAQGVVYDTAFRGAHHQVLMRDLGLLSINRVTAAKAGSKQPRRSSGQRQEKTVHVEDRTVVLPGGSKATVALFSRAGAIGIGEWTEKGDLEFVELRRIRTHRNADKSGRYRWYNDYALPPSYGGKPITVRLHANDDDTARRFNRTENVRAIAPSDPDFANLFRRRNDAESINRALEDTMYLRRAHSVGHRRQLVNLLGYALVVNSLALQRHVRRSSSDPPAALAA